MLVDPKVVIDQGLARLQARMDSRSARVLLYAIGRQESRFEYRRQIRGPARGFWQFERGTRASRGGVWGVYLHPVSREHLRTLCDGLGVEFDPNAIYETIEYNDELAAGVARLLLWTDADRLPLPLPQYAQAAWDYYDRTWHPGKPRRQTWDRFWREACAAYEPEVENA